jgi:hypothetical protein
MVMGAGKSVENGCLSAVGVARKRNPNSWIRIGLSHFDPETK